MVFEFVDIFLKALQTKQDMKHIKIKQPITKRIELSPRRKETIRKNKSIEDFMKHQVPWIL